MSSFILKYLQQNPKNSLVAKRTIDGGTLGRPVDSWVAFGDRATMFQQHCRRVVFVTDMYFPVFMKTSVL